MPTLHFPLEHHILLLACQGFKMHCRAMRESHTPAMCMRSVPPPLFRKVLGIGLAISNALP
jgi:hypothetical protein